jgi:GxxExxY protein
MLKGDSGLTYAVIGCAMETHSEVGPGLPEQFYHTTLADKLNASELWHRFKPSGRLMHRGIRADEFEADILFDARLVIEVKVFEAGFPPEHFTQVICYQKFWSIPVGLLLDFGKESLIYKRLVFDDRRPPLASTASLVQDAPEFVNNRDLLGRLWESFHRIYSTYGLGYRETTYRGLLLADLTAEAISHRANPTVSVGSQGKSIGNTDLNCVVVDAACAVMTLALRDSIRAADRAILQTYFRLLNLPWGIIVNFGKRELQHKYVIHPRKQFPWSS